MAYAWMPGTSRIRAELDGGPLGGGAPRAVWLTLGAAGGSVSVQSAAQRLISERRPCHLVWDPVTGAIVSVLRAGRALGAAEHLDWAPGQARLHPDSVNAEGRVCVQIGVLGQPSDPFTAGTLAGVDTIMSWLDSWGHPAPLAGWPARGLPRRRRPAQLRALGPWRPFWCLPGTRCENVGPGAIDVDRITGPHGLPARSRGLPVPREEALAIPA